MTLRNLGLMGAIGLLTASPLASAWAQIPSGAEPSLGCRLFPLACPGPVPAPPPPLLGTPEEQAAAEPAPAPKRAKQHARHRKQAKAAQQ